MSQRIYFDESGYTGNNLLHPKQNYFSYASVATDDDEARLWVERVIKRYNIQGGELKGANLVKYSKGKRAITELLDAFDGRIKISISDKKFALAGKLHEYIFEPCYSKMNSIFYGIGFHRFIANVLYMEFNTRGAGAEELFSEFEHIMWKDKGRNLETIFSSSSIAQNSEIIRMIREFAQIRHEDIRSELNSLASGATGKWVLDLTQGALYTLLTNWGTRYKELTAVCDSSKPLLENQMIFNSMIGNTQKLTSDFGRGEHPITFNLSGPIKFMPSHECHGIQIADVIAAAAVHVFSTRDEAAVQWRKQIVRQGIYGSVIPDQDELKLEQHGPQLNTLVLRHLHQRATQGISLTKGMPRTIAELSNKLRKSPLSLL